MKKIKEFTNITELTCNLHCIPKDVSNDVMKRILDWVSSGEPLDSDYVNKQLKYASYFLAKEETI